MKLFSETNDIMSEESFIAVLNSMNVEMCAGTGIPSVRTVPSNF